MSVPVLTLARGLFGVSLLMTPTPADDDGEKNPDLSEYTDIICDDGLSLINELGNVRLECTLDGCGPIDEVCYDDLYFKRCLDQYGRPTERCEERTTECEGVLGCLNLWIDCEGKWECPNPYLIGCGAGSCTEELK